MSESRKDDFVTLVQTASIVRAITQAKDDQGTNLSTKASIAVHAAIQCKESELPQNLMEACDQHIQYVFENSIPKPRWLIGIL